MRYSSLGEWLAWQETLHPAKIDLGLERVRAVAQRMGIEQPPYTLITVGGTNGKGSCVAMLEAMLHAAGYRVGAYTSPHLLRYNERVRIDRAVVGDTALCEAFGRVDAARRDISLSYFEFGTLAALDIFSRAALDAVVLEVGMGGRLDAVNVMAPDVAVVTTVAVDHSAWLGTDREQIGAEKAGIFRVGRPAVYGDTGPPASVVECARDLNVPLLGLGRDFGYEPGGMTWSWWGMGQRRHTLPVPRLRGSYQLKNAAAAITALDVLKSRLPVGLQALRVGLSTVDLPGRLQVLDEKALRICDVAHNPQAAAALALGLSELPCTGRTHAVLAMLADKDLTGVVRALADTVHVWHVAGLDVERAAAAGRLAAQVRAVGGAQAVHEYETLPAALAGAGAAVGPIDRIVVCGSFYTVAAALESGADGWRRREGEMQDERLSMG
ncbi:MAG: bifunctional tetrahydrofolate synthase/dihydrofolate synthase [Gammaproteobacteria bacterium]|jgi:dihydrofolate synthase/folylpolyglutamate synthase